tara:strand:+ start:753 stop:878 length:126 start_codon:yes stop_codon:yes gene_type:complete
MCKLEMALRECQITSLNFRIKSEEGGYPMRIIVSFGTLGGL